MDKKTIILKVALQLFSERGYAATSTRMISKQAAVSEGLIFRHYQNKEGLLNAVYAEGKTKIKELYAPILKLEHPKVFLKQLMSVPFLIKDDNISLWRFFYNQQWYDPKLYRFTTKELYDRVFDSFKLLDCKDPQTETETFFVLLEGIITNVLLKKTALTFSIVENVIRKFDL
tara:strand:- start:723 stop:1241 length:519 start_codon:yes stop_codon:yes gene_type:complete